MSPANPSGTPELPSLPPPPRPIDSRWARLFEGIRSRRTGAIVVNLVFAAISGVIVLFTLRGDAPLPVVLAVPLIGLILAGLLWSLFSARIERYERIVVRGVETVAILDSAWTTGYDNSDNPDWRHLRLTFSHRGAPIRTTATIPPECGIDVLADGDTRRIRILVDPREPRHVLPVLRAGA